MAVKKERTPIRLTKTDVESLSPDPARSYFNPVEGKGVPGGLSVRVMPSGQKSWALRYRFHGIQKTATLGRYPAMVPDQARKAAVTLWEKINKGEDPAESKRADRKAASDMLSISELADRFITEHIEPNNKASTAKEHKRLVEKFIKPKLGSLPVKGVGTSEIATMLHQIQKRTPIQGNRIRAVLSKMFSKAELWELRPVGSNPVRGQDRAPETKKSRNLTDHELFALGMAIRRAELHRFDKNQTNTPPESPYALVALRIALLTGMRKGEILALQKPWVSLDAGKIIIPAEAHKTGGKTGQGRLVHLCRAAVELLRTLPKEGKNPFIIVGEREGKALVDLQSPWERLRESVTHACTELDVTDVTIHDLRRTFASVAARLGYPELFISALLGHAAGTVTQGYARVGQDPLREAVETIGSRIAGLLSGSIDLRKEAKAREVVKRKYSSKKA